MGASESRMGLRQRLIDLIDRSGVSDRHLSILATGTVDTVRNIRRGATPHVNSIEALLRCFGFRFQIVLLDDPEQHDTGGLASEKQPHWARQLREEIRQDLHKVLGQDD